MRCLLAQARIVVAAFAVASCVSGTSSSTIDQSTYGPRNSAQPSEHKFVINSREIGSEDDAVLERHAKAIAVRLCPSGFVLQTQTYFKEYDHYNSQGRLEATLKLEWHVQCTAEPRAAVSGGGARLVESLVNTYSKDSRYFDLHGATLAVPPETAMRASLDVLNRRGHRIWQIDERQGTIVTVATRFGALSTEYYDQYFIAFERLPNMQTQMTFKLLSHWRDFTAPGAPMMKPHSRETVYGRAAAFTDAVSAAVGKR